MTSLIDDAIKFTSRGGCVEIRFSTKSGNLIIAGKDLGIGSIANALSRNFDGYYQLEQSSARLFGERGSTSRLLLRSWMNK